MLLTTILCVCAFTSVNVQGEQRIAGGNPVEIQQFPFSAALLTNNGQGTSYIHGCGGSILTNQVILSAASCFYTNTNAHPVSWWRARVGSTYSDVGGSIHFISAITSHSDFSPTTLANDIALVRTTVPLQLASGSVEVARLSGAAYTFTTNQVVRAIGWGATSNQDSSSSRELREVEVFTINQTTCTNRWNELGFTVTANNVCTGWLDVGVLGQCVGDSGSPLLDQAGGYVIGVFSRTEGCANSWYPDVNTRLQPYIPWILSNVY